MTLSCNMTNRFSNVLGKKIARLSVPYEVAHRLICFFGLLLLQRKMALACSMRPSQCASLKHAVTSILVPKRSKWVCREALYCLVTPGHLLSPDLFLNYGHLVEYILFFENATSTQRAHLFSW